MKNPISIIFSILLSQLIFSQDSVKMTSEYGSKNQEINDILMFESLGMETLTFEGSEIKGKYYEVSIKEYKNGVLINTKQLFDGSDSDLFKINSNQTSFKFFSKIEENKLKTFIKGNGFGSKKYFFTLEEENDRYALKDFQGSKKFQMVSSKNEFPILAIITPTKHKNGFSSYCEVAQSNISPDKFGEKFNIPHYFIISMRFK